MKNLERLRDILMDSLGDFDTIKGGELKMGELEALSRITDTIKNADKICMLKEETDGGYSSRSYGRGSSRDGEGSANIGDAYGRGSSYARGGRRGGSGSRRYGVRSNYSRSDAKDAMLEHLEEAMNEAEEPRQREAIEKAIRMIENA